MSYKIFGLIGKDINYSFSKKYFEKKFKLINNNNFKYENFDLKNISEVENVLVINNLCGLNVTIPYKEKIIPYLDDLTPIAEEVGAVNTVYLINGKKIGDNTDVVGFQNSLNKFININPASSIILGSGGASKAINYVLKKQKIKRIIVSRNPIKNQLSYEELNEKIINENKLIINCTPLGTYPKTNEYPEIPYSFITKNHYLFDLIYNPKTTIFLKKGIDKGAKVINGFNMLIEQAEASWKIWNNI
ncbi:MAG: shikimate dehydrogenase [Flavobacteriaceae bacterium]|nr:shikimate dehydrogenase [Flavobacteriaceae bacterium]|tara:strand:- start:5922 stop:6659 length:738 start_codon:yes stop_codon:yes gene_type:complete